MLSIFVAIIARLAVLLGMAFILGKTVPRLPQNKVCRFVFLFVLCVPFNFIANYVNVWTLGYHKMGWTWNLIFGLFFATWLTFLPPQEHNSNTR
ncbi:MAG: hypothetical protein HY010_04870 [Acidobacteria bacterium]|nr:hypothetical protein [Acidobacteriota bacterium]